MVGTVSNIIVTKKFGFISAENGQEYFFHREDMVTNWDELVTNFNQTGGGKIKVSFTPEKAQKGPRARDITTLDD